jgi:hypothetical protein
VELQINHCEIDDRYRVTRIYQTLLDQQTPFTAPLEVSKGIRNSHSEPSDIECHPDIMQLYPIVEEWLKLFFVQYGRSVCLYFVKVIEEDIVGGRNEEDLRSKMGEQRNKNLYAEYFTGTYSEWNDGQVKSSGSYQGLRRACCSNEGESIRDVQTGGWNGHERNATRSRIVGSMPYGQTLIKGKALV